jgi:hypothetical protein
MWMPSTEWKALSAAEKKIQAKKLWETVPADATQVEVKHALRQLEKFFVVNAGKPVSAYEVMETPELSVAMLPLDACDRQQATVEDRLEQRPMRTKAYVLRVLLPTRTRPRSRRDYAWHEVDLVLPKWAQARYTGWNALKPTLRITEKGRVKVLLPLESPTLAPVITRVGESALKGFALDWGQRRTLTGAVVERGLDGDVTTTGRQFVFQSSWAQQKMYRNRAHAENLAVKISHIEKLLASKPNEELRAHLQNLLAEKTRQWQHLSERNKQLAHTAAKWVMLQARNEGCSLIFREDLSDYEVKGMGRTSNGRVSMQVRAAIFEQIRALAPVYAMRELAVPAAGTSSHDSRCGQRTRHIHAPDNPKVRCPHKNWVLCECGHSADRDHSAAERIGARGFQMLDEIIAESKDWEAKIIAKRKHKLQAKAKTRSQANALALVKPKRTLKEQAKAEARLRKTLDLSATPVVGLRSCTNLNPKYQLSIGQGPCGPVSPSGVSRGTAVAETQAVTYSRSEYVRPFCREALSFSKCELDRMLLGNWGSIRFTRLRPQGLTYP